LTQALAGLIVVCAAGIAAYLVVACYVHSEVAFITMSGAVICGGFVCARAAWPPLAEALLLRQQRSLLRQRLLECGGDALPAARRAEEERIFWRGQQLKALAALHMRFTAEPPTITSRDALLLTLRGSVPAVVVAALLCASSLGYITLIADPYDDQLEIFLCSMVGITPFSLLTVISLLQALQLKRSMRRDRQEFARSCRRIATMAELAGGLTLAEHDAAGLRGALSGDVARLGALSEVDP
jgi:hypothetical protein